MRRGGKSTDDKYTHIRWSEAFTQGLFQVVSIGTTTGFTTAEFYIWLPFLRTLLLFASFVGGSPAPPGVASR